MIIKDFLRPVHTQSVWCLTLTDMTEWHNISISENILQSVRWLLVVIFWAFADRKCTLGSGAVTVSSLTRARTVHHDSACCSTKKILCVPDRSGRRRLDSACLLVTSFLPSCENIIWATLFTANISADCPQFAAVNFPNPTSPPVCNLDIADRPGDNKVQDTTDTSCKRNWRLCKRSIDMVKCHLSHSWLHKHEIASSYLDTRPALVACKCLNQSNSQCRLYISHPTDFQWILIVGGQNWNDCVIITFRKWQECRQWTGPAHCSTNFLGP